MHKPINRLFLLPAFVAAVSPGAFSQNMFRGNLAHTGVYETEGPRQFKGIKWAFRTGGAVVSSPALADSVAYFGSDDKNLYAVDTATGKEKWKFATGGPVRSSPAVVRGTVFFGSYDGAFYALEEATGKLRWKFETAGERMFEARGLHGYNPRTQVIPDLWDFYLSSPAVDKGLVYFGSGDKNFYALDAQTGQLKWKFATQDVVHSSPALADGVVYFGSWDTYLYALDAATGQEKWKFKTGEDNKNYNQTGIQSSPVVSGGVVYFGCRDSHVYAVDAKTGQEKWNFKTTWVNASPAVYDGVVYFGTSIPPLFQAVDANTGKERFTLDAHMIVFSSPAIAGGMAYYGSFNGRLYAVDLKIGKFAWEFQTPASKQNALGAFGPDGAPDFKVIFTSDFFEDMYVAGAKIFSVGAMLSSPTVDRGVVYLGSADGNLYAVE